MPKLPNPRADLRKRVIAVYGVGFVGTAIVTVWLRAGAKVVAVDSDSSKVTSISEGRSPTKEPKSGKAFSKGRREGRLISTLDGAWASRNCQIHVASVPVGFNRGTTDLEQLDSVVDTIGSGLKKKDIVIVTPTIPVGTSNRLIRDLELRSGLLVEDDFYYIYSPERISYGRAVMDIEENYPAIISGAGQKSVSVGKSLYNIISSKGVIEMSSTRTAEMEKLLEGVYRDVNIALANEFESVCRKVGVDFWETRNAANSQPNSRIHRAGVGVGGFCIPVYPRMLIQIGRENQIETRLTLLARTINQGMPGETAKLLVDQLRKKKRKVVGAKVAVLGLAFRGGVPDRRLSPTYDLVKSLSKFEMDIAVHDPLFETDTSLGIGVKFSNRMREILAGADVVLIATDHQEYENLHGREITRLSGKRPLVLDGRGILTPGKFTGLDFVRIGTP